MPVLTLIANPQTSLLTPQLVDAVRQATGAGPVDWLDGGIACDLPLAGLIDASVIAAAIGDAPVDYALQHPDDRKRRALIADMDSTMIDQECIDELAAEIGIKEHVAAITAKAMNGELDFEDAVNERVGLLKGLAADVTDRIIENRITLASGGKTLVATMRKHGAYTALVSGGFTSFTSRIAAMLGFHENRANVLETEDGKLTGTVRKPILGAEAKVEALRDIAATKGLSTDDFIAVGDGANDLPMLKLAGTGVALHAKPVVATRAKYRIDHGDLTALLYLQGYRREEFADA